jgi:C4-dicarboxylate-specific signal transduction histidine kinase
VQPLNDIDAIHRLADDVLRIASGEDVHRVDPSTAPQLRRLAEGVNLLADRMAADRTLLAENIESLERTNRELRAARDQVIRSARLASVGTLAAGIAHEVGNPLGAILGFLDVAKARSEAEGRDTEILEAIRYEARRIDRIVRGLLDYARPPGHGADVSPAGEVVARVRTLLERQGKLTETRATWEIGAGSEQLVEAPQRLEQVLVNLLLNALHAVEGTAHPHITVCLEREEGPGRRLPPRRGDDPPELNYLHRRREELDRRGPGSVEASEEAIVISVSDNGPGIPPEAMDQLFDPFFTTKEPGEGTGLGLSICARLVEGMGGTIEAGESEDGGARFVVRLPATHEVSDSTLERTTEIA